MSKVIVMLVLFAGAAGLVGCAREDAPDGESSIDGSPAVLEGAVTFDESAWEVVAFAAEGPEVVAGAAPTIEFDRGAGTTNGSGGCNRYRGSYELAGGGLSFGPAAATMMACEDEALNLQEQTFFAALDSVASFEHQGESLTLLDAEGAVLLSLSPRADIALVGTEWRLTGYNNGKQAVVSVMAGTVISVTFDSDSVSGSAGCNQFRAACAVTGEVIEIGMPAATSKFCSDPEGVMDQEAAFLVALPTAAVFRIEGDQLDLRTSEGSLVAVFSASKR